MSIPTNEAPPVAATAPANTGPATPPAPPAQVAPADTTTPAAQADDDKGAGSKDALKADLARERDARQALAAQLEQFKTGLAQALGVESAKATPEQLAEQLTAAQAETATAQVQLALYKAAPTGVDVAALLDSASFTRTLAGINPADAEAIAAKVTDFVAANPRFRTTVPGAGLHDAHAGGGAAGGKTTDINELLRAAAGR